MRASGGILFFFMATTLYFLCAMRRADTPNPPAGEQRLLCCRRGAQPNVNTTLGAGRWLAADAFYFCLQQQQAFDATLASPTTRRAM